MVLLERREFEELKLLAEAAYPEEFCAILLGRREGDIVQITRVMATKNVHERPRDAYAIAPEKLIAAQRKARAERLEIVGFAHSHPDQAAHPSEADLQQALWVGCCYAILSVRAGRFHALSTYRLSGASLEERRFLPEELKLER